MVRNTEDQDTYPDYFDGWYRRLEHTDPSERVITKPAILGGGVFLPAFTPNEDVCGFGGDSNFYAVYYETGTAYFKPLLPNGTTDVAGQDYKAVKVKIPLGEGMPPPAVGIHAGRRKGRQGLPADEHRRGGGNGYRNAVQHQEWIDHVANQLNAGIS